jgi:UDP-N-acetylglucosamine--N-acetylmuramyl-(pentapeptide) pyrophosphoryl-undecaprenol N-acetylglucosamine transferase
MNVGIACGGTGGHLFPGLAVAEELQRRGHDVTLWLDPRAVESAKRSGWAGPIITVKAAGFPSGFSLRSVVVACRLLGAVVASRRLMREQRPDIILAMGSYASFGPVQAARFCRVPIVLHEANAIPGRAVSLLAPHAKAVAVTFDACRRYVDGRGQLTGFPVRHDLTPSFPEGEGLDHDCFTVLLMGGSQGAHALNEIGSEAVCRAHAAGTPIQVVHLTGPADESFVRAAYEKADVPHLVYPFLKDMGLAYGAAHLAVCRAGAATCMELVSLKVPALLVPLPHARRDHQTANARVLVAAGAAELKPQSEFTVEWLVDYLAEIASHRGRLEHMRDAGRGVAVPDAAARIATLLEEVAAEDAASG